MAIDDNVRKAVAEYLRLAEQCFALVQATLDPEVKTAFTAAGRDYVAKAKELDPGVPIPEEWARFLKG